jgi:hypothetical protein
MFRFSIEAGFCVSPIASTYHICHFLLNIDEMDSADPIFSEVQSCSSSKESSDEKSRHIGFFLFILSISSINAKNDIFQYAAYINSCFQSGVASFNWY